MCFAFLDSILDPTKEESEVNSCLNSLDSPFRVNFAMLLLFWAHRIKHKLHKPCNDTHEQQIVFLKSLLQQEVESYRKTLKRCREMPNTTYGPQDVLQSEAADGSIPLHQHEWIQTLNQKLMAQHRELHQTSLMAG